MTFYLTGDFNGWRVEERTRFVEVRSPYGADEWGGEHPGRSIRWGAWSVTVDLPPGVARLKLLEGPGWERQWSTMAFYDQERPFEGDRFRTACGVVGGVVVPRGSGMPPHVEVSVAGGATRFDFHPGARWLSVRPADQRAAGPSLARWRSFAVDARHPMDVWVCTPYGYPAPGYRYPVVVAFDGRSLLYGEDPRHRCFDDRGRQLPRVLDVLARHGVIPPVVLVGVETPRDVERPIEGQRRGFHDRRAALYDASAPLFAGFRRVVMEEVLPALAQAFPLVEGPAGRTLLGHSWGADCALRWLAAEPEDWAGVVALSPSDPLPALRGLVEVLGSARPRVALAYARHDLGPFFLTDGAAARGVLASAGLPHLVQLMPDQTHDPATLASQLPATLGWALGG